MAVFGAAASRVDALVFLEFVTYDGVDLKVKSTGNLKTAAPGVDDGGGTGAGQGQGWSASSSQSWAQDACTGHSKLLNSECAQWLLLRAGDEYIFVHGELSTTLQTMDHNSAECLKAAVDKLGDIDGSERFLRRVRVCTTDRASSNLRCERFLMASRPSWTEIHLFCNVHVWARIHTRTFSLHDSAISAMISLSLSLASGAHMSLFRASFRRVLARDMKIVRKAPTPDAQAYRSLVLDRFVGGGSPAAMEQRQLISRLAGGDWRVQGTFEFYATDDSSRGDVLALLYSKLVPCLAGHEPKTFPRHRWTGVGDALRDLGLLACIHGLLKSVCLDFYFENFSGATGFGAQPQGVVAGGLASDLRMADIGNGGIGFASAGGDADASTWAAANRARRKIAISWLEAGDPARDLMLLATVSPPMVRAMGKDIEASSMAADTKTAAAAVHPAIADSFPGKGFERCQMVMAAHGVVEGGFRADWSELQDRSKFEASRVRGVGACRGGGLSETSCAREERRLRHI